MTSKGGSDHGTLIESTTPVSLSLYIGRLKTPRRGKSRGRNASTGLSFPKERDLVLSESDRYGNQIRTPFIRTVPSFDFMPMNKASLLHVV